MHNFLAGISKYRNTCLLIKSKYCSSKHSLYMADNVCSNAMIIMDLINGFLPKYKHMYIMCTYMVRGMMQVHKICMYRLNG